MDISVIIPVLNMADTIEEQLQALAAQDFTGDFEILVVDNGSTDGTVDVVRSRSAQDARVRLVDGSSCPLGGAAAKNRGVEQSASNLIAFCDADDVVHSCWLRLIHDALLVAPVVTTTLENWSLNPHLRTELVPQHAASYSVYGFTGIPGGAFGIRRDAYWTIGGFDEHFRGAADSELAVRLGLAGYTVAHLDDAIVSVRLREGVAANFRRHYRLHRSLMVVRDLHRLGRASLAVRGRAVVQRIWRLVRAGKLVFDRAGRQTWMQRAGEVCSEAVDALRRPTSAAVRPDLEA
ncbi:MAG: glycosyltransferase [Actinomycetota bacterium]